MVRNWFVPFVKLVGPAKRKLILELARNPGYGYELANSLDLPRTGIYAHLAELRKQGYIGDRMDGTRRMCFLTPDGQRLADLLTKQQAVKKVRRDPA